MSSFILTEDGELTHPLNHVFLNHGTITKAQTQSAYFAVCIFILLKMFYILILFESIFKSINCSGVETEDRFHRCHLLIRTVGMLVVASSNFVKQFGENQAAHFSN